MTPKTRIVGDAFYSDKLVRFSHCDPAGIVFYPHYFVMFNGLVEDWFNEGLGLDYAVYITGHRLGFPIVSLACEFVAPSKIGEVITLGLRVEKLGRSSFTLGIDCRHEDEKRLAARIVLVAMDLNRQKAVAIPDDLRALFVDFRDGRGLQAAQRAGG